VAGRVTTTNELETKASPRRQCSRQDSVTRVPITQLELITISIVTIRSIWHKSAADFFWVLENFRCEFCGATYRWNYETFSALWGTSSPLTDGENSIYGKKYRCTATFSALNCCRGILFKCLGYLYELGRTNFFTIFDCNFAKIVAPPNDDNKNSLAHLPKKRWKQHQNRPINRDITLVQTMSPTRRQTKRDTQKTPYFRTYIRRSLIDLPQTLHGDRGRRDHQRRWNHFSIQRIVFPIGCTEKFGLNDWRAVSQQ